MGWQVRRRQTGVVCSRWAGGASRGESAGGDQALKQRVDKQPGIFNCQNLHTLRVGKTQTLEFGNGASQ